MITVCILLLALAFGNSCEANVLETFVKSIIDKWQLLSPTVIVQDDIPEICMILDWVLCLTTDLDIAEFKQQLDSYHQSRQQDSIIFIGRQGHEDLIMNLATHLPSLFSSNIPVFMPAEYTTFISLRLDSNVIFYENERPGTYELVDTFAVKGGPPIVIPVGYWNIEEGVILKESMNRWDRRTDLKGANFYNCVYFHTWLAEFIRDKSGKIIGTKGYLQDVLFYVTEKLNLNVVTVESTNCIQSANCTCFNPRTEIDAHSSGLPIALDFTYLADLPYATIRTPITLIAAKQKGRAPNMWVYVQVFGLSPWILFIVSLSFLGTALAINKWLLRKDEIAKNMEKNIGVNQVNELFANFGLVYIYAIQMGNHLSSMHLTPRILTLTTSILTFIMFTYFATQTTSEMTSGPPDIPVRTFEDVIHYDYKVIAQSEYFENILRYAKSGTAKNIVFHSHLKKIDRTKKPQAELAIDIFNEAIKDPKLLIYMASSSLESGSCEVCLRNYSAYQELADQMLALKMDDAQFAMATIGLQKDSEFFQIFNYYFIKEMESGFLRRLYRYKYVQALFIRENFEMMEPPPLGFNNVMFSFIFLAIGICLSTVLTITELIKSKLWREQRLIRSNGTNELTVVQNQRRRISQWVTQEIQFADESKVNGHDRHDRDGGKDGDQGTEDIMDNINASVGHIGEAEAQLKNKHQGTTHK